MCVKGVGGGGGGRKGGHNTFSLTASITFLEIFIGYM